MSLSAAKSFFHMGDLVTGLEIGLKFGLALHVHEKLQRAGAFQFSQLLLRFDVDRVIYRKVDLLSNAFYYSHNYVSSLVYIICDCFDIYQSGRNVSGTAGEMPGCGTKLSHEALTLRGLT